MSVPRTVADVLHKHVTLELECIDRLYLNLYQPDTQGRRDPETGVSYPWLVKTTALVKRVSPADRIDRE